MEITRQENMIMALNPMMMIQLKTSWDRFVKNHPKFPKFWKAACKNGLAEGTVIDIKVTSPDGTEISSNIKVTGDDMELIRQVSDILSQN